ncbi:uncharacterized protein EI97DRAFT_31623 [Westerdykella ornata]|uniref:Uncharacterized protein n=1 Tax=Westerdykella ornata TaxID=318751 RepID=A0A6A6K0E8_WESOR|nr:uncharacterized protein EI97DRAFT_31623 [Westerdykella ornata]KAF2281516.1 hypothetical protein EI97DRAFT_31623 [Westerdykella ornata]
MQSVPTSQSRMNRLRSPRIRPRITSLAQAHLQATGHLSPKIPIRTKYAPSRCQKRLTVDRAGGLLPTQYSIVHMHPYSKSMQIVLRRSRLDHRSQLFANRGPDYSLSTQQSCKSQPESANTPYPVVPNSTRSDDCYSISRISSSVHTQPALSFRCRERIPYCRDSLPPTCLV